MPDSKVRGAVLMLAKAAGMKPSAIREVICGVLLVLPDPNNWSEHPNIWDEVVWLMDDASGDKVHSIVEALYAELAAPRRRYSQTAPEFARRLNDFLAENGIGWKLIDGHIAEKATASMAFRSGRTTSETTGRAKKGPTEAPRYQVALSFAGEQRDYVEEVARHLQSRSIAVFYDGFEEVGLWGRSGVEAFHAAFAEQSAYVVMFISEAYVSKAWPSHERRSALSRMIEEEDQYILPVRFDDTRVPGLPADTLYLSAHDYTTAQLATMIAQKLGVQPFAGKASEVPPPRMTSPTGEVVFDYSSFDGRYVIGSGVLEFETKWTKASDTSIHVYNDPTSIHGVALARRCASISQVQDASSLDYTSRTRTPSLGQIVVLRNTGGFYAALQVLGIKDDSRLDDRDEIRFRYAIQSDGSADFAEFVDL
ncbi:MAG: TIR domain-containing protein [Gemmatimonadota bacterium]|nr:TIR domain-containing protein [Gemmatimonadota bacterium]MDE2983204.1 TIR domain-containing protein [Gemmatimonadota bacterium]